MKNPNLINGFLLVTSQGLALGESVHRAPVREADHYKATDR